MNTCKTCKWWGAAAIGHSKANHCENPKSVPLSHLLSGGDIPDDWVETGHDEETVHAAPVFVTGPDFGCIHHEEGINPNRED
jgi:hypothetical protein